MAKQRVTLERIMEAMEENAYLGFCLACGAECEGLEPDARERVCEHCGRAKVYGAEECLMMLVA